MNKLTEAEIEKLKSMGIDPSKVLIMETDTTSSSNDDVAMQK